MPATCSPFRRTPAARLSLAAVIGAALLASMPSTAEAEPPRSTTVGGFELGEAPASLVAKLSSGYPQCDLQRSRYRASPGESTAPLAIVAINEGTMNHCQGTPDGRELSDIIVVRFAHPSVVGDGGAFEILVNRHYPDPLLTPRKDVRHTLDKVLADLKRRYGKPNDERRERSSSQSGSLASTLGVAPEAKRHDELVRLVWAPRGSAAAVRGDSGGHGYAQYECDCGDRYLIADIETTRSPATRPPNRTYVTRVSLFMQQADVRRRQEAWNAQWQRSGEGPQASPSGDPAREPAK